MAVLRLPAVLRLHFVTSAPPYHRTPPICFVSPAIPEGEGLSRPGCFRAHPFKPRSSDGTARVSQVPGESFPHLCRAHGTPAAPTCHAFAASRVLPSQVRPRRPQRSSKFRGSITRLQCSLSTLPDSAFPTLARLASGGWQALTGWDSNPLDSFGEFQARVHLPPIPTPQASPGATYCLLFGLTLSRHPLQKLAHIPDLLVRRNLTLFQERGSILVIERPFKKLSLAAPQILNENLHCCLGCF
jgi:hypothetical protein